MRGDWRRGLVVLVLLLTVGCAGRKAGHPREGEVRAALVKYFAVWSSQDMEAYAACFHPQARVFFLDKSGRVTGQGLTDFVHGQRMAHAQSPVAMREEPVEMKFLIDDTAAQAQVTWRLVKGTQEERGTDLFTLKREGNDWKIVSLVFYGE